MCFADFTFAAKLQKKWFYRAPRSWQNILTTDLQIGKYPVTARAWAQTPPAPPSAARTAPRIPPRKGPGARVQPVGWQILRKSKNFRIAAKSNLKKNTKYKAPLPALYLGRNLKNPMGCFIFGRGALYFGGEIMIFFGKKKVSNILLGAPRRYSMIINRISNGNGLLFEDFRRFEHKFST